MLTGSCLCRKVRFEIRGDLGSIVYCHCESCRKAQGTAFVANAPLAEEDFVVTSGAELIAKYESSPGKHRCFCRNCGSPVYSYRASIPGTVRVRLGTLDGDPALRPVLHSWVGEKAPWFEITDGLPQFRTGDPESLIENRDRSVRPSPEAIVEGFQAFHRTAAIKAGVELDLFTAIGEGVDTEDDPPDERDAPTRTKQSRRVDDVRVLRAGLDHLDALVPLFDGYREFYHQSSDPEAAHAFLRERIEQNSTAAYPH